MEAWFKIKTEADLNGNARFFFLRTEGEKVETATILPEGQDWLMDFTVTPKEFLRIQTSVKKRKFKWLVTIS